MKKNVLKNMYFKAFLKKKEATQHKSTNWTLHTSYWTSKLKHPTEVTVVSVNELDLMKAILTLKPSSECLAAHAGFFRAVK